ncbi:excisionase family DNA-binding protein [Actinokineospora sp. 24-640]
MVVADERGEEALEVPRGALELFARILAHMAAGRGVSIVPAHAELTTQQAADLLNVSRPFLIGLLQGGETAYRMVGRHRRVKAESLYEYMRSDDQARRAAADELAALNQEMGRTRAVILPARLRTSCANLSGAGFFRRPPRFGPDRVQARVLTRWSAAVGWPASARRPAGART